jgi:hypothetical protein
LIGIERRYRDFLAKKNNLSAREPSADDKLLTQFLEAEERSRGVAEADGSTDNADTSSTSTLNGI